MRISVGTFFFLQGLCFSSWASRIPTIQQQLSLDHAALGVVLFALPVGLIFSLLVSGWLIHRFGSRQVLIVTAILYASVLPLIGLVQVPWHLIAVLFTLGFCGNLSNIAMNTQAVSLEALYGRPIMASFHGLNSLAGFSGAAIGMAFLALKISPFIHFSFITALTFAAIFVTYRFTLQADENSGTQGFSFSWPDKKLRVMGLIVFCGMVCEGTLFDWSGVYFQKVVAAPQELSSLGYLAFMYTMAAGRFVGDWLAVRTGIKRMIQLNGLLIFTGLMIAILFPYVQTATLGFLLAGAGVSTIVPFMYGAIGKTNRNTAASSLAAVSSMGYMGFLIGPPVIGMLAQVLGLQGAFAVVAVLGSCAGLLVKKVSLPAPTTSIA
jgi:MFS family permease